MSSMRTSSGISNNNNNNSNNNNTVSNVIVNNGVTISSSPNSYSGFLNVGSNNVNSITNSNSNSSNSINGSNNTNSSSSNNNNFHNSSKIIDAARKGNAELVQKLLKKDLKKLNKRDEKGDTCLHKAALFGHADCIENTSYFDEESSSVYTWKLQKVSTLRERAISPVFKVGQCKWMIAVYPKGKSGGDHLSIYLKVAETVTLNNIPEWFFLVNFKFSVINQRDGSKFTRQVEGKKFKANVEDWGFPQFFKLSILYDAKNGFINYTDDSILIELQMEIINDFSRKKFKDNISDWGLTLLHWVAYKGSYDGVRFLLSNGANPNVTDYKGRTPLDWCAYNGDLPTSEILISTGMADVNCKDHEGFTPLHKAVMNGHLEVARLLVRYGAQVNAKNTCLTTPLSLAIRVSRLWCVESLIKWGADINIPDKQNRTPLHWAICLSESRLLGLLIKYGCSNQSNNNNNNNNNSTPNNQNNNGIELNIEDIAETSDNFDTSENNETQNQSEGQENLEDTDSDDDQNGGRIALSGSPNNVNPIIIHQNNVNNTKDDRSLSIPNTTITTTTNNNNNYNNNNTIIYLNNNEYHFQNNHYEEFIASVVPLQMNVRDQDGYTPLHKAIWGKGKISFVKILLERGADPKICTKDGRNAVHLAVAGNEYTIAQLLIEHSPQCLHQFDEKGHTPLHKAVINGNLVMMEMLIQHGADVNLCSPTHPDVIPLADALRESDISCIIFLLQKNADPKRCQKSLLNLLYKRVKVYKNKEIDPTIPKCTLNSDMKYLLNNINYKDITFIVENKPIYAWKGLLCARSDYFRAMFEQPLKESLENEVRIESVDHITFLHVMEYIYTGELSSKLTLEESMPLLIAANRFMLPRLKLLCESLITKEFNTDNIYNIFKLADMHETTLLLDECVRYLAENHLYIPETDDIVKIPSFRKSVLEFLHDSLNIH
ncbi:hypothetical protein PPL_07904 [Heterostelium album PN500]|uniref:Ankyrin repeat-containing protein n=1 Tax=Heterostelium pallidum (strain ATCC 26659 / Pp 5 / PN500) TaxID=670386 RepID=D3BHA2_HETP5|nr:hypothetical protein PPL_07904 [Heterostelium album PN500]EFA79079.1 hypothetical protein PPL_07904 [Heterostelium album PN500]|eukprot:XP_020431201.1 hypothetical protein PPL_07904 [Heterostelium album PN500]